MFSLHRNLEDFELLHLHRLHCWLDMCVCHLFNDSQLDSVLRPTAVGIVYTQLAA